MIALLSVSTIETFCRKVGALSRGMKENVAYSDTGMPDAKIDLKVNNLTRSVRVDVGSVVRKLFGKSVIRN